MGDRDDGNVDALLLEWQSRSSARSSTSDCEPETESAGADAGPAPQ
jgi:hypothetical protein